MRLVYLPVFGLLAASSTIMAAPVMASEICEAIRAELAQTSIVIGNPEESRSYASAITRQDFEIRKTRQNMMRIGCSQSVSVIDESGRNVCDDLATTVKSMEANKQDLLRKRQEIGASGGLNPRRRELLAALQQNQCDQDPAAEETTSAGEPDRPFTAPAYPENGAQRPDQPGYRTMCVRTCDGSFFPISAYATPANFANDAAQCQKQCPGASTELYYHALLTQEAADMVSASTGRAYRDMPFAFAYRNAGTGPRNSCSCAAGPTPAQTVITSTAPASGNAPLPKPEANERPYDPANDKVRQVGPKFMPGESGGIDLKNPAGNGPQPVQQ